MPFFPFCASVVLVFPRGFSGGGIGGGGGERRAIRRNNAWL